MQDYLDFAEKNGVILQDTGPCQFCGAITQRGVHECLEIFNFGFSSLDFSLSANHIYKFLVVDSHTLQHPEIHGRWNNHFHLARLTLILKKNIPWTYKMSPMLSDVLKSYKKNHESEYLEAPATGQRGSITTTDIKEVEQSTEQCKNLIRKWSEEVYLSWEKHHHIGTAIAERFINEKRS